jgi:hypothetical protein
MTVDTRRRQERGGDAAALAALNEKPMLREIVIEQDTRKFKFGDGETPWNDLPYPSLTGDLYLAGDFSNSLPTAVATIGSSKANLYVDVDTTVPTDLIVPDNIRVVVIKNALITVPSGVELLIKNFHALPSVKVFTGAGTAAIWKPRWDITWWTGSDPNAVVTAEIDHVLRAANYVNGAYILLPANYRLKTGGGHYVPNFVTIEGVDYHPDNGQGRSGFTLTSATAEYVFSLTEDVTVQTLHKKLRNFAIDASVSTTGTIKVIKMNAAAEHGAFHNDIEIGINLAGAAAGSTAFHYARGAFNFINLNMRIQRCHITLDANQTGFFFANENCSIEVKNTIFQFGTGSIAIDLGNVGTVIVKKCEFNGVGASGTFGRQTETLLETITGTIASGDNKLQASRAWVKNDLGMRVKIAGVVDSYIKGFDGYGHALLHDNATAPATGAALEVYRYNPAKSADLSKACIRMSGLFSNISISECQDEGVNYFLWNAGVDWYDGVINLKQNYVQSFVRLDADCSVVSEGNTYYSLAYEVRNSQVNISSNDIVMPLIQWNGHYIDRTLQTAELLGIEDASLVTKYKDFNSHVLGRSRVEFEIPVEIRQPRSHSGVTDVSLPEFGVGISDPNKKIARFGLLAGAGDEWQYYKQLYRDSTTGTMWEEYITPDYPQYRSYGFKDGPVIVKDAPLIQPPTEIALTGHVVDFTAGDGNNGGAGFVFLTSDGADYEVRSWFLNPICLRNGTTRRVVNANANGSYTIKFPHEYTTSTTAAYRFRTSTNATLDLLPGKWLEMVYLQSASSGVGRWFLTLLP